jgi:hypothetical protein
MTYTKQYHISYHIMTYLYQIVPWHTVHIMTYQSKSHHTGTIPYIPQNTRLHTFHYHTKSLPYCHDNPTHYIPGSDESSVSTSEGSDSSCEAMEGPHGDDDGLVITSSSPAEDL